MTFIRKYRPVAKRLDIKICLDMRQLVELMDQSKGMAPGDPVRMAQIMIKSVEMESAPMHSMLGAQALSDTLAVLKKRVADYEAQADIARMADHPDGEP